MGWPGKYYYVVQVQSDDTSGWYMKTISEHEQDDRACRSEYMVACARLQDKHVRIAKCIKSQYGDEWRVIEIIAFREGII